jgi:hypothetical protein
LTDFVDAQLNYYSNCTKILQDLSKQIGGVGIANNANTARVNPATINSLNNNGGLSSNFTSKKKAKVLFDYEATDPSEISVSANQVIYEFIFFVEKKILFESNFVFYYER